MMEKKQDILGYVGLGATAIGMIATVISKTALPIAIGSTVGVGCNVFSRKQSNDELVEAYNSQEQKLESLIQQLAQNKLELGETLTTNQTEIANKLEELKLQLQDKLEQNKTEVITEITRLDSQHQQLADVVNNLEQIESMSQELRVKPDSAQFFYQRGMSYEKLGNLPGAIEDYSEAIKINPSFAPAYHKRGVMQLHSDHKQKAVDDLRKAALLYFEQGDIESYQQAREMSRDIHELHTNGNGKLSEMVIGSELFTS